MKNEQIEMVTIEQLLPEKQVYRVIKSLIDFQLVAKSVKIKAREVGAEGYGVVRLVMCLILQFMENLSDREFERFIGENIEGKWFCKFKLMEKTPDYSTICKFRTKIGCKNCGNIFAEVKSQLTAKGYMSEVFTFVDSTALVSRLSMWKERDKAIADGYKKLNNANIERYSADKGFVGQKMRFAMAMKGLHPMVILRNNMKDKNRDKDRFISRLRSPYESTFSKQEKRVCYAGVVKNQAAEFLFSVAFNFRRLVSIINA